MNFKFMLFFLYLRSGVVRSCSLTLAVCSLRWVAIYFVSTRYLDRPLTCAKWYVYREVYAVSKASIAAWQVILESVIRL